MSDKNLIVKNLGDIRHDTIVGGKSSVHFLPNMNISFHEDEFFINLNRKDKKVSSDLCSYEKDKTKLHGKDTDVFYIDDQGRFKWDIDFDTKPESNVFDFDLKYSDGIEFWYQDFLTPEEIKRGVIRSEEVTGSYAVYCNKIHNNYKTGKLCHIYRPLCIDAEGNKSYALLKIEKNTLTITIDQDYMDKAVYPMTLDPTFGYTSQGASSEPANPSYSWATRFNCPESGIATSISAYVTALSWQRFKFALYEYTPSNQHLLSGTVDSSEASSGWTELSLATEQAVTAREYALALQGNNAGVLFYTDTIGASSQQQGYVYHEYADGWADPATFSFNNTNRFSIFCTYESGSGEVSGTSSISQKKQSVTITNASLDVSGTIETSQKKQIVAIDGDTHYVSGIELVQSEAVGGGRTQVSFPSANTEGNTLILFAIGTSASTVTDSNGNIWVDSGRGNISSEYINCRMFYCVNCAGGANTVSFSAYALHISEWSGVSTVDALHNASSNAGRTPTGANNIAVSVNVDATGDLVFIGGACATGPLSAGTGFTASPDGDVNGFWAYSTETSSGDISAYITDGTNNDLFASIAISLLQASPSSDVSGIVSTSQKKQTAAIIGTSEAATPDVTGAISTGQKKQTSTITGTSESRNDVFLSRNGTVEQNISKAIELAGGISAYIDPTDVVVIKGNAQWPNQGYTHTLGIKAVIDLILAIPGFSGEIILCDNIQGKSLDGDTGFDATAGNRTHNWADENWTGMIQDYRDLSLPVSIFRWTRDSISDGGAITAGLSGPADWTSGTGWVRSFIPNLVNDGNTINVYLSYPIFESPINSGRLIDMKNGVWESGTYTGRKVKTIQMPTLNNHGTSSNQDYAGITSAIKSFFGNTEINSENGTVTYSGQVYRAIHNATYTVSPNKGAYFAGQLAAYYIRNLYSPVLYVTCAEYSGYESRTGNAANTKTVLVSTSPSTLDYVACRDVIAPYNPIFDVDDEFIPGGDINRSRLQIQGCIAGIVGQAAGIGSIEVGEYSITSFDYATGVEGSLTIPQKKTSISMSGRTIQRPAELLSIYQCNETAGNILTDLLGRLNLTLNTEAPPWPTAGHNYDTCWEPHVQGFTEDYSDSGNYADGFTIACWLYFDTDEIGALIRFLDGDRFVTYDYGKLGWNGGTDFNDSWNKNLWTHLALCCSTTETYVYKDGILVATASGISLANRNGGFMLGGHSAGYEFPARINDIHLWNKQCSETEVENCMNGTYLISGTNVTGSLSISQKKIGVSLSGTVENVSDEIEFTTEGSVFAPVIQVTGTPEILWTFSDDTTSDSLTPSKDYGTTGTRVNKLKVTPWSAVTMINIGYDAEDGGSLDIPLVPNNFVSLISNISVVADNLQTLCISYNLLTTIDLSDFAALETLESFRGDLQTINLSGCVNLKRLCLEENGLNSLDISACTLLEDLRGARNDYASITWPATAENLWHMCLVSNTNFTVNPPFNYPAVKELWVSGSNISGNIEITSQDIESIWLQNNQITGVDLSSATITSDRSYIHAFNNPMTSFSLGVGCALLWELSIYDCQITALDITDLTNVHYLYARNNDLSTEQIDGILAHLDTLSLGGERIINVSLNNPPSVAGMVSVSSLQNKGWSVTYDEPTGAVIGSLTIGQKKQVSDIEGTSEIVSYDVIGSLGVYQKKQNIAILGNSQSVINGNLNTSQKKQITLILGTSQTIINGSLVTNQKKQSISIMGNTTKVSGYISSQQKKQTIGIRGKSTDSIIGDIVSDQKKQSTTLLGVSFQPTNFKYSSVVLDIESYSNIKVTNITNNPLEES